MSIGTVSVAKVTLNAHERVTRLIEDANKAIIEAMRAAHEMDEPMAENLFGVNGEAMKVIAQTSKAKLLPVLQSGVPIWSSRLSSDEAITAFGEGKVDPVFQVLLKTFSVAVPMSAL